MSFSSARAAAAACGFVFLAACATDPWPSPEASPLEEVALTIDGPAPAQPLTVGVYNCVDTSGQRRPSMVQQELSTAVPQDCTPFLISAVRALPPGYVRIVERGRVDDLLRERQLATLALRQNGAVQAAGRRGHGPVVQPSLAPLRVAEIMLVGQVVAYDRSTRQATGGVAVGGVGGSAEFVTDLITFSLRAVAVQTGEVLAEETVTKSVTSLRAGGRFVRIFTANIVDIELGGAGNEPVGLALRAAVRGSVQGLVQRGQAQGWWRT